MTLHRYLSTGCYHGDHKYCQSTTGRSGEKQPARCKFCEARCVCWCHSAAAVTKDWFEALTALSEALAGLSKSWAAKAKPEPKSS
jgi:hypothetical protein